MRINRRTLIRTGGAAMAAGGIGGTVKAQSSGGNLPPHVPEWMQYQGQPYLNPAYGTPSPHEADVVRRSIAGFVTDTAVASWTPIHRLHGIITPNGLTFERHHGGVPEINPDEHRLTIHGLVDRPLIFTMEDLMRFPSVSELHFLECSGNSSTEFSEKSSRLSVQMSHGLLSCCEWTGVRLSTLLDEVGIKPESKWLLAEGADAAAMTRSIPIEKALDDAIIVYAQNGEALRPEQGYPVRLFLPGFEGNSNIKWLRRIEIGEQPWQTREETSKYTDLLPDGTARQFTFNMPIKSVVTFPNFEKSFTEKGFYEISGLAWSGNGKVAKVEVSVDGGSTWQEAQLQEPIISKCLTRFRLPFTWTGQPFEVQSRATDEHGDVQPARERLIDEVGRNALYHYNGIQGWKVAENAEVTNANA